MACCEANAAFQFRLDQLDALAPELERVDFRRVRRALRRLRGLLEHTEPARTRRTRRVSSRR